MPKRPSWLKKPAPPNNKPDEFFGNRPISETYMSFGLDAVTVQWIEAMWLIDNEKSAEKLVNMLKSNSPLTETARLLLADLIERHKFTRRPGNQRTPAYDFDEIEQQIIVGVLDVKLLRENTRKGEPRLSVEEAIEQVCKSSGIPVEILSSAYRGTRGSTKRADRKTAWLIDKERNLKLGPYGQDTVDVSKAKKSTPHKVRKS